MRFFLNCKQKGLWVGLLLMAPGSFAWAYLTEKEAETLAKCTVVLSFAYEIVIQSNGEPVLITPEGTLKNEDQLLKDLKKLKASSKKTSGAVTMRNLTEILWEQHECDQTKSLIAQSQNELSQVITPWVETLSDEFLTTLEWNKITSLEKLENLASDFVSKKIHPEQAEDHFGSLPSCLYRWAAFCEQLRTFYFDSQKALSSEDQTQSSKVLLKLQLIKRLADVTECSQTENFFVRGGNEISRAEEKVAAEIGIELGDILSESSK